MVFKMERVSKIIYINIIETYKTYIELVLKESNKGVFMYYVF